MLTMKMINCCASSRLKGEMTYAVYNHKEHFFMLLLLCSSEMQSSLPCAVDFLLTMFEECGVILG